MVNSVIIVAGGAGTRFGSSVPKQFLNLDGKPVLMHTIKVFHLFDSSLEIIVVLPQSQLSSWKELCRLHQFSIQHQVIAGGKERYDSVKAGILAMNPNGIVGIHDGVRPLVSNETLTRCFKTAEELGNAIPVIPVVDSLREVTNTSNQQVDRHVYRLVQTPQCFNKSEIIPAFQGDYQAKFTDDASVAEHFGMKIQLVEGNKENIKITNPLDLHWAEWLIQNNKG